MREITHLTIPFSNQQAAKAIRVAPDCPPAEALKALNLPDYHGMVVLHGGASKMEPDLIDRVRRFLIGSLAPFAQHRRILVVDGGTHAGAMGAMGDARRAVEGTFPLVGVSPYEFVAFPGHPATNDDMAPLDESHSHFILVEGGEFGIESDLLVGLLQASGKPGIALIINGGEIVLKEIQMHAERGSRVVIVRGSGRVADEIAAPDHEHRQSLPPDAHLEFVDINAPEVFRVMLGYWFG